MNNLDLSKLDLNTYGVDAVQLPENHEEMIQKVSDSLDFVNKNREELYCNKECQSEKKERELYQLYMKRKTQLMNAPKLLEESEKKYITFKDGGLEYEKMREKELEQKISEIVKELTNEYNSNHKVVKMTLDNYKDLEKYNSRLDELIKMYNEKIKKLDNNITSINNENNIADRNTYYDMKKINMWSSLNNVIQTIMWVFVIVYFIIMIRYKKYKERIFKIGAVAIGVFVLFPFHTLIKNIWVNY